MNRNPIYPASLKMYAVYYNPSDFPGLYVLRVWHVSAHGCVPDMDYKTATDLVRIREQIPRELSCIPREQYDDPCIIEVWC